MALTPDEQKALALLEDWERLLQEVLTLIEAKRSKAKIQEAYKAVKQGLESEYRTRASGKQNEASVRCLVSTFYEAFVHLDTPVNGQPDQIHLSVYNALIDISHSIHGMRAAEKE